jgi:hypothetical protein
MTDEVAAYGEGHCDTGHEVLENNDRDGDEDDGDEDHIDNHVAVYSEAYPKHNQHRIKLLAQKHTVFEYQKPERKYNDRERVKWLATSDIYVPRRPPCATNHWRPEAIVYDLCYHKMYSSEGDTWQQNRGTCSGAASCTSAHAPRKNHEQLCVYARAIRLTPEMEKNLASGKTTPMQIIHSKDGNVGFDMYAKDPELSTKAHNNAINPKMNAPKEWGRYPKCIERSLVPGIDERCHAKRAGDFTESMQIPTQQRPLGILLVPLQEYIQNYDYPSCEEFPPAQPPPWKIISESNQAVEDSFMAQEMRSLMGGTVQHSSPLHGPPDQKGLPKDFEDVEGLRNFVCLMLQDYYNHYALYKKPMTNFEKIAKRQLIRHAGHYLYFRCRSHKGFLYSPGTKAGSNRISPGGLFHHEGSIGCRGTYEFRRKELLAAKDILLKLGFSIFDIDCEFNMFPPGGKDQDGTTPNVHQFKRLMAQSDTNPNIQRSKMIYRKYLQVVGRKGYDPNHKGHPQVPKNIVVDVWV